MTRKDYALLWCGVTLGLIVAVSACAGGDGGELSEQEVVTLSIQLTSPAFTEGSTIPVKHTCDGEDVSPLLSWSGVPQGAKSIALIADDPDAPHGTWVHWVLYALPPDITGLPEGVPATETTPQGGTHGTNYFKRSGYGGPCPPPGNPHRYFFKLYALDNELALRAGARKDDLLKAMDGHILAQGQLMGTYRRR